jgi:hypothetical protein
MAHLWTTFGREVGNWLYSNGIRHFIRLQSHGVMESWSHGVMESWSHGIMESWNHGIMESFGQEYVAYI